MDAAYGELVADLTAEQAELLAVLDDVRGAQWYTATPAKGWDVRDTVAHLADTDELAVDTCLDGERSLNAFADGLASAEDVTLWGVLRGRKMTGAEVRGWWRTTSARERETLSALAPDTRVPWGLGMRAPSFVTARLMETWAHGLDVRAAIGAPVVDTARLRHIAWLGYRALPYAFTVAGRQPPADAIRVELDGPGGERWELGPPDASACIDGPAGEFCRLFAQRITRDQAPGLRADGDAADAALDVARAFL